jgi:hypothetical protein
MFFSRKLSPATAPLCGALFLQLRSDVASSPFHQPPYDQDDYDQNSNLINVTHGIATFSSALDAPNLFGLAVMPLLGAALIKL